VTTDSTLNVFSSVLGVGAGGVLAAQGLCVDITFIELSRWRALNAVTQTGTPSHAATMSQDLRNFASTRVGYDMLDGVLCIARPLASALSPASGRALRHDARMALREGVRSFVYAAANR
jgi:hypothetical protein